MRRRVSVRCQVAAQYWQSTGVCLCQPAGAGLAGAHHHDAGGIADAAGSAGAALWRHADQGRQPAELCNCIQDAEIVQHFVNSMAVTVPSVALVVLISSLAAFALARLKFFARDIWFYLLIMTLMLPIPTLVVPIFQINKALGLNDSYMGLILPYTALGVPFAIVILRSFFAGFLREIEEAAILDGCTPFGIYWRIMMPVSWPAVAVVIIWQFMTSWNEFILALVTMNSVEVKPLDAGAAGLQRAVHDAPGADVRHFDADYDTRYCCLLFDAALYGQRLDLGRGAGIGQA